MSARGILNFHNANISPLSPVELWPTHCIVIALNAGGPYEMSKILAQVRLDTSGRFARKVDKAIHELEQPLTGLQRSFVANFEDAKCGYRQKARQEVARQMRDDLRRSGLTLAEAAAYLGTSAPRLSTYVSGKAMPGADIARAMGQLASDSVKVKEPLP